MTPKKETFTVERRWPVARIWVEGKPKSARKDGPKLKAYIERVRETARSQFSGVPLTSKRLLVEVWYSVPWREPPDVDNVLKPIVDAMKGVVFEDDRQVRQVKATALPDPPPGTVPTEEDRFAVRTKGEAFGRLHNLDRREFLVLVFDELQLGPLGS
jgi:Holliday junction resolvase RusA-like endonuclease